jgi:hypothetical protein
VSQSQYDADVKTARGWLIQVGIDCAKLEHVRTKAAERAADKVAVVVECIALFSPEQLLRLRCASDAFNWQA